MVDEFPMETCKGERSSVSLSVISAPRSIKVCTEAVPPTDAAKNRGVRPCVSRGSTWAPFQQKNAFSL